MKRYLLLTAAMMGVMLLLFGLVKTLGGPLGVGLVVADVLRRCLRAS